MDSLNKIGKSFGRLQIIAMLSMSAFWSAANADTEFDELLNLSLEELMTFEVVTPTRNEVTRANVPGSVTIISRQQIQHTTARTIPEMLRLVAGVNVRWNPMVQTISVRSFGASPFTNKVLLLIDGVPYNSWNKGGFPQHPGFDFFDLEFVDHLEIVRGPGSALYGENAFNGVINIVTMSGKDADVNRVRTRWGSDDTRVISASRGFSLGEEGSLFLGARQFRGQIPTELWKEAGTGNSTGYDFFAKAQWRDFVLTYYRLDDVADGYVEYPDDFPPGTVFRSADEIEQEVNIVGLGYDHTSDNERWRTKAKLSFANRDGSHCGACHAPAQHESFGETSDHGYQYYADAQVEFRISDNNTLLLGAEGREIDSGDHSVELHGGHGLPAQNQAAPVLNYNKYAIFLQDQAKFFDDRLHITTGVRYDSATSPSLFDSETSPRLDVVYKLTDSTTLRAQYGEAARYPSFSELYQATWFLAAETPQFPIVLAEFEANLELGPEYIRTISASIETVVNARTRLRADFFRNEIDDPIVTAYPRFRQENHPQSAVISGVELEWQWEPVKNFSSFFNYSYQHNERRGNGTTSTGSELAFTYAPRHKVNAGLHWRPNAGPLSFNTDASWISERMAPDFWYPIAFGTGPRPLDDYAIVNARIDYDLPFRVAGGEITMSFIGRDLFNEAPIETLVGLNSPTTGRQVMLQLEYAFAD